MHCASHSPVASCQRCAHTTLVYAAVAAAAEGADGTVGSLRHWADTGLCSSAGRPAVRGHQPPGDAEGPGAGWPPGSPESPCPGLAVRGLPCSSGCLAPALRHCRWVQAAAAAALGAWPGRRRPGHPSDACGSPQWLRQMQRSADQSACFAMQPCSLCLGLRAAVPCMPGDEAAQDRAVWLQLQMHSSSEAIHYVLQVGGPSLSPTAWGRMLWRHGGSCRTPCLAWEPCRQSWAMFRCSALHRALLRRRLKGTYQQRNNHDILRKRSTQTKGHHVL